MSKKITLIPIAMITPTRDCIYAPSRIERPFEADESEYKQVQDIPVSIKADGKSDPTPTPSYIKSNGDSLLGRFIIKK